MPRPLIHIVTPILLALAMNAVIYAKGWNSSGSDVERSRLLPPGYVIAIVWTLLLACLGYVHYKLYPNPAHWIIVFTILYCISYPILTSGLRRQRAPMFNMIALFLAVFTTWITASVNVTAAYYTLPLLAWTAYVNAVDQ